MAQTTNYIPKYNSSTTFNNSVIYQNNSNIGIGTTSPLSKLHVIGIKPAEITSVSLTNSTGIIVFVQDNILENKISIDISNLAKGVYILTGYFGDSTVSEKIILK